MPVQGEVWSLGAEGGALEAVVVEVGSERVDLVSRTSRRVVLTIRTMGHMWSCKRTAHLVDRVPCFAPSCESLGYVGDRFGHWFCGRHVPRNQPLLFPGDDPLRVNSFLRGMFVRCPVCKQKQETDPNQEFVEGFVVFTCNVCRAWWTVIFGQGLSQDGMLLVDDMISAVTLFKRRDYGPLHGVCGSAAYAAIKRSHQKGVESAAKDRMFMIAGVNVQIEETYGPLTLAVFGAPRFDILGGPQHHTSKVNVGDEYETLATRILYTVERTDPQKAFLKGEDGSVIEVGLADFWSVCRKVVRRTSYEILMSDDDLV